MLKAKRAGPRVSVYIKYCMQCYRFVTLKDSCWCSGTAFQQNSKFKGQIFFRKIKLQEKAGICTVSNITLFDSIIKIA